MRHQETCSCPLSEGRPACKGEDRHRFLGPKGGHLRRSNYADDFSPRRGRIPRGSQGSPPTRLRHYRPVAWHAHPPGQPEE
jgi:hypothetical protein